jgi:hypothetical protein
MNALSRFSDVRGVPDVIFSDNQTSFCAAERELREFIEGIDFEKLKGLAGFHSKDVQWHFNTPRAPHQGGVYEIMVKAMKRAFKALTPDKDLTEDMFKTIISRCMALLNQRPLWRVDVVDANEFEVLTPNSFLVGQVSVNLLVGHTPVAQRLQDVWKKINEILDLVWKNFHSAILDILKARTKWNEVQDELRVGDIVLVVDINLPRGLWKLGRVLALLPSEDGLVRNVTILTNGHSYDRPVVSLIRLCSEDTLPDSSVSSSL